MITILCSGSRGDVQPYLALAQELTALGLTCRIATGRTFESFVRSYGIDFYSIDVDYESAGVDSKTISQAQKADGVWKMFRSFHKLREFGIYMVDKYHDACLNSDAIIFHPGLTIGYYMAQRLGIPAILASPFPLHGTKERPSVIVYGKVRSNPLTNWLSYRMLQGMLWMAAVTSLKVFWKTKYGKLPEPFGMPFEWFKHQQRPALISCSDLVFSRPADWNPHIHQHGYWVVKEPKTYEPSAELVDFLATGEKPISFGFGSMFDPAEQEQISQTIIEALRLTGKRGILLGMNGLSDLPKTIMALDSVPHTWLFPQMAAVCHHGGAGTSAAGFLAGVPSIILPFALDQYAWAQRSFELGVGSKPLPIKKMSVKRLSEAILFATQPEVVAKAKELGEKLSLENGARDCARVISDMDGLRNQVGSNDSIL